MKFKDRIEEYGSILFKCPGCKVIHILPVAKYKNYPGPIWDFNRDFEKPTINPSIFVNRGSTNPAAPACHSFIRDGRIQFLNDSSHELAGQTVDLPEWDAKDDSKI